MKSLAVVAIGSRIMKDDSIGILVAEAIRNAMSQENIDVIIAETDFEYGFEAIKPYESIIVLDAMACGDMPGEITVVSFLEMKPQMKKVTLHDMSLIDRIVFEGDAAGSLIGIEAKEVDLGFGPSEALQNKFDEICENVKTEILKIKENLENA